MENQQQQANLKAKVTETQKRIFMSQSTFRDIQHKFVVSLEITRITAIIIVITRITAITVIYYTYYCYYC